MSVANLPPELKTRKVQSLSGDSRKIAEELLAEKFDIAEEVVPERDPFRGTVQMVRRPCCGRVLEEGVGCGCPSEAYGASTDPSYGGFRGGHRPFDRVETWVDFSTSREYIQYSTSDLSLSGIRSLMYEFDKRNIRRECRELRMGRNELRRLMSTDPAMMGYLVEGAQPMIMGMPIHLDYDGYGTITLRGYRY